MNKSRSGLAKALLILFASVCVGGDSVGATPQQSSDAGPLRIALVGIKQAAIGQAVLDSMDQDKRLKIIDSALVNPVLKGFGYDGSINMSTEEARRLGSAIGCDFFVLGKTESVTRSTSGGESHQEAYAGIMIVDARTGRLALFDFAVETDVSGEAALARLARSIEKRAANYADQLARYRAESLAVRNPSAATAEAIEDIPDASSPRAAGFQPPEFLNRVKPEYTSEAELADITATVEASVVFRSSGAVGNIEILKWAGFGLDQSAEQAIRQLKFKPATRDKKPISVRATVRYNFRRVAEPTVNPTQP